jgi:CubicO group peptidase (beta-lactamase class C family)
MKKTITPVLVFTLCLIMEIAYVEIADSEPMNVGEDVAAQVDDYLNDLTNQGEFSGSVLIANDNQVIISKGYGMANIELSVPNASLTKFRIGSVTKQFTALAIMILQERELLSIHDPISTYVLDCPEAWKAITIHHLLTHTSGIPDFVNFPEYMDHSRLPQALDETIGLFKDRPLQFAPGARFEYSNSGYILLGFIIEVTTGQSYEDFLRQNIFDPLGMNNSGYDSNRTIIMDRADGYKQENGILLNADHIEMDTPHAAGALYSTVEDMFLWDQALYTDQLVSLETLDAIFTPYEYDSWYGGYYGYGWNIGEKHDREEFCHGGGINGFTAFITRFPQEEICIVILSNFELASIDDLTRDLTDIAKNVFDPMLMAHWTLDEAEGMFGVDSAGDNDGTVHGEPHWQPTEGKIDGALEFDGVNDYVSTAFVLNPADGAFSVAAWIRDGAPGQVIISQLDGHGTGEIWLCVDTSNGNLMTSLMPQKIGRYSPQPLISEYIISDGQWHHISFVWDGSYRILYADGIEVAKDTAAQNTLKSATGGLYIGADKTRGAGTFFSGLIDDVRIYNEALTAEEIAALVQ